MKHLYVSIIVPVFNGQKVVAACIESLLTQDYPMNRYEIIVVDNGSTDRTKELIEGFQTLGSRGQGKTKNQNLDSSTYSLRYVYEFQRGSYKARNTGISYAKGEIIAFTDSDCIADKSWLKHGVEAFSGKGVGCVAGGIKGATPTNFVEKYQNDKNMLSQREASKFFNYLFFAQTANAFYRKEVFDKIGFFEDKWQTAGDADFSWRMQRETDYKVVFKDDAVVYHKHRGSVRAYFLQGIKNGEGNVLLFKRYQANLSRKTVKQILWTIFWMVRSLLKLIFYLFFRKENMDEIKQKEFLGAVTFIAREAGRVKGSIKNKVFYL